MSERKENLLLAALPDDERKRLNPFLEWRAVEFGETLIEPEEPIKLVFFPFDAVTSTVQEMDDGSSIETGLMGVEGVIGVQLWLRMPSTSTRTFVQVPGSGHIMSAKDFKREVMDVYTSPLNILIARYTHAFLCMTSIAAACNRLHTIDQRLCRWLKLIHNRVRKDEFPMRQEFMAQMLGVHRPTISTAAGMLQKAGFIEYARGQMRILDAEGLVAGACECYELMESQMDRIFDYSWRELAQRKDRER